MRERSDLLLPALLYVVFACVVIFGMGAPLTSPITLTILGVAVALAVLVIVRTRLFR